MTAAAIVLRRTPDSGGWRPNANLETLLIRTSSGKRFTFPKGHCEKGESMVEAAQRELSEEAGYEAQQYGSTHTLVIQKTEEDSIGYVLLCEARKVGPGEPGRIPVWLRLDKAIMALCENRPDDEALELVGALKQAVKWYSAQ